ncbi:DNA-binding Xre family transcriptional regulator [Litoreibacter meonggei]|uniref:DNA-binding Xre family transcriptional regulator n=1 Tax=Litoreibacter meonggei TaxID=1049199 RepID=A0A497X3H0_9RHOB|nr:DNA-binding Xre family transcriptional regulator [Litoreibacter meonggei]
MKLDEYLKINGISGASFAERIGVNPATVFRIRTGRVFPHRSTLTAIVVATDGAVSANDLVEIPKKEKGGHTS